MTSTPRIPNVGDTVYHVRHDGTRIASRVTSVTPIENPLPGCTVRIEVDYLDWEALPARFRYKCAGGDISDFADDAGRYLDDGEAA